MYLSAGLGKLNYALKTLRVRWDDAKSQWSDSASHDFEEEHLQGLEDQIVVTIREINRLAQVLDKARQECE